MCVCVFVCRLHQMGESRKEVEKEEEEEGKKTATPPVNNVYINFKIERIHEIKISAIYHDGFILRARDSQLLALSTQSKASGQETTSERETDKKTPINLLYYSFHM